MNRLLLTLINIALCAVCGMAQTVSGTIREQSSNDAIPYATVSLLRADSSLYAGAISDEKGNFKMQANTGQYILQVSYIGYKTACRTIDVSSPKYEAGAIYLSEETTVISEVEIKADKPLIQRQMDKIVMNVSNSPFAVGSSGEDMLKKAPGVVVDKDGNVSVNGKSVAVYIDGRPSYLSGEQLRGLLQGTDATTISKIEIITNPSAKYDAAGQGGIINIKLTKNKSAGVNGTLSAAYGGMYFKEADKYLQNDRFSLNINHRGAKTYTAFSISQNYREYGAFVNTYMQQPILGDTMRTISHSRSDGARQYYTVRLSNDWYIDDKNTFGFMVSAPVSLNHSTYRTWDQHALVKLGNDTIQDVSSLKKNNNIVPYVMANLNYTYLFSDSLNRELTVNADYNRYYDKDFSPKTNTTYKNNDAFISRMPDQHDITTKQLIDIASVKADFQTAFWQTGLIECGVKWSMSHTNNAMTEDSVMPSYNHSTKTSYDYTEHIAAAYFSAAKQFGEHWNVKLGLRGELTASQGTFTRDAETKEVKRKPYFNLFPSVFAGYNPTDQWSLGLTYTRRIDRPGYYNLNPFINYYDAHIYQCGNPELKPELANGLCFEVTWSRYINLSFEFNHTHDVMAVRPQLMDNGDLKMSWVNFGTEMSIGGSLSFTEIPIVPKFSTNGEGKRSVAGAWLALTANIGLYDHINSADASQDATYGTRHTFHYNYYGALNAYLPKDWQLSFNGWGFSPSVYGYGKSLGGYSLGFGIKKSWEKQGVTLSANVNDLTRSMIFREEMAGMAEGYISQTVYASWAQCVNIGLTWQFGKYQEHRQRNVGDNAQEGRLGGAGDSRAGR